MRQARLIASLLNNNSLSYLPPVAVFSSRAPLCRSKGPREHHSDKKARCRALGVLESDFIEEPVSAAGASETHFAPSANTISRPGRGYTSACCRPSSG